MALGISPQVIHNEISKQENLRKLKVSILIAFRVWVYIVISRTILLPFVVGTMHDFLMLYVCVLWDCSS